MLELLDPPLELAGERSVDLLFLEAGAGGIGVAVNQPDHLSLVAGVGAAHHEANPLSRRHTQPVAIADELRRSSSALRDRAVVAR